MITLFLVFFSLADAHRGDEEKKPKVQDRDGLMSLQTLPRGNVHSETRKSSVVSSHEFHDASPASLLEDGAELSQSSPSGGAAPAAQADKSKGVLTIQLPMEKFVGNQKTTDGDAMAHVTLSNMIAQSTPSQMSTASSTEGTHSNQIAWRKTDFSGQFQDVSYSVIRIQTIAAEVNWFEPYQQPQDFQLTGTGWAAALPGVPDMDTDPIFITNAHVVRDAHDVQIQLPAIGEQFFEAYVPLICDEFDLAVVQLVDPEKFIAALKKTSVGMLKPLEVVDAPLILGLEVASVGFPLGSNSMKLSRGVISGTEEVADFICYQTTAPISPGSSGGPLFALDAGDGGALRVIGATFASAASRGSQNINYVVAGVAIVEVLEQYKKQRQIFHSQPNNTEVVGQAVLTSLLQAGIKTPSETDSKEEATAPSPAAPSTAGAQKANGQTATRQPHTGTPKVVVVAPGADPKPHSLGSVALPGPGDARQQKRSQKNKRLPHFQFRIAPIDAIGIEASPALYKTYGCENGVFISKILKTSVFYSAGLKAPCFLTEVDGIPLDSFGMGRTDQFLHDPIPFESLMMMKVRPGDSIKVKTCGMDASEKNTEHTVSMEWTPEKYQVGINNVVEPFWDPKAMEYELFAGITVMQLSINHIIKLLRVGQPPTLGRWLLPENQEQRHLLITHVEKGTYASRVVAAGMVVSKVNGQDIDTLDKFRSLDVFIPKEGQPWTLETDRGVIFATNFKESMYEQIMKAKMGLTFMFCQSVVEAWKQMMGKHPAEDNQAGNGSAAVASLAQTSSNNKAIETADTAKRVTRTLKRQAFAMSVDSMGRDADAEEVRRRMRVAQAGFFLGSSDNVAAEAKVPAELQISSPM